MQIKNKKKKKTHHGTPAEKGGGKTVLPRIEIIIRKPIYLHF